MEGSCLKAGSKRRKPGTDRAAARRISQWLKGEGKDERPEVRVLLKNIKEALPRLKRLFHDSSGHWTYEDRVYRFYHQSFKVFQLQDATLKIVEMLKSLAPSGWEGTFGMKILAKRRREKMGPLNSWFLNIVKDGTDKEFKMSDNDRWEEATRPILEAFFHARFFLEMVVKYGKEIQSPPAMLPSGWAAVLYLYNMR
jgi:hypothetical protein